MIAQLRIDFVKAVATSEKHNTGERFIPHCVKSFFAMRSIVILRFDFKKLTCGAVPVGKKKL